MKSCKDKEGLDPCLRRRHAELCGVFANATRLEIMLKLGEAERTVGELAESLGVSSPNISQHLRIMRDQGAVHLRKAGRNVYYRVSNPKFLKAIQLVREGLTEEIRSQLTAAEQFKS